MGKDVISDPRTPDCGPHCKVKPSRTLFELRTIKIKHCECKKCHGKPASFR